MLFEYSAGEIDCARKIEVAVDAALNSGFATPDIGGDHTTQQITDEVIRQFSRL